MKKVSFWLIPILTLITTGLILWAAFKLILKSSLDSNYFVSLFTFSATFIAIFIYYLQKREAKRDAATVILQEIRRAEDSIKSYKTHKHFLFTQRIIANNSWQTNIHLFVNDLTIDDLDKISDLYSMGELLDHLISKVFELNFNHAAAKQPSASSVVAAGSPSNGRSAQPEAQSIPSQSPQFTISFQVIQPFWEQIFQDITSNYHFIYDSAVCDKLKEIAKK